MPWPRANIPQYSLHAWLVRSYYCFASFLCSINTNKMNQSFQHKTMLMSIMCKPIHFPHAQNFNSMSSVRWSKSNKAQHAEVCLRSCTHTLNWKWISSDYLPCDQEVLLILYAQDLQEDPVKGYNILQHMTFCFANVIKFSHSFCLSSPHVFVTS